MGHIKIFFLNVAASLVVPVATWFITLIPSISTYVKSIHFWFYLIPACTLATLIGFFVNKKYNRFLPKFDIIDPDFHVMKKEIIYKYENAERTKLSYSKNITVRALKNELDSYKDKYSWTSRTGGITITSGIPTHTFRETAKKNVWQFYEIDFNKKLSCEEWVSTVLNFDLNDPEKEAVPFLSSTIEEPTDLLILTLILPVECGVEVVNCVESNSIGAKKQGTPLTKNLSNGKITWEVTSPKLLHTYEINWIFPAK